MSNPYFGPNLIPGIMIWTKLNIIDLIEKKPPGQKSGNVCGSILKQEPSQPKDLKIGLYLFSSFCLFGFFCCCFFADFECLPYPLHFQIRCYVPKIYKTCFPIQRACLKTHVYVKYTFTYKYKCHPPFAQDLTL